MSARANFCPNQGFFKITLRVLLQRPPLQLTFVNVSGEGVAVLVELPTDGGHDGALNDGGVNSSAYSLPLNSSDAANVEDDVGLVQFWA